MVFNHFEISRSNYNYKAQRAYENEFCFHKKNGRKTRADPKP